MKPTHPPVVLTFAAADPTSGAGLQADLLTQVSLGCHPCTVVTAVTVQDTAGVTDFVLLEPEWVAEQARAILEDMPVAAFKLGMLGSAEIVAAIAEVVSDYPDIPLVVDPVLASGRGDELATEAMAEALCALILPQTTLITPNGVEAQRLATIQSLDDNTDADTEMEAGAEADTDIEGELDLDTCAARLMDMGCEFVLITGSHEQTPDVINTLYGPASQVESLAWDRLPASYHGSGCTLASAIAALLAQGVDLPHAVREAQEYTYDTLRHAYRPGMGQFIPDRLFWAREEGNAGAGEEANEQPAAAE